MLHCCWLAHCFVTLTTILWTCLYSTLEWSLFYVSLCLLLFYIWCYRVHHTKFFCKCVLLKRLCENFLPQGYFLSLTLCTNAFFVRLHGFVRFYLWLRYVYFAFFRYFFTLRNVYWHTYVMSRPFFVFIFRLSYLNHS